ncbi:hypothetical protein RRG08_032681 [Elysia crispata]|uniref:Uncharacterized protein n=1 Tax=Elysia crispata TaxID=231223 RepID=A0AAE1CQA3_9GAST|nr:hypothetical protein RRG08_032681 [Elysia crispata]
MDQQISTPLTTTKLTIASILLTTMIVNSLPLLPYGQNDLRDFPASSSSSSSASGASSAGDASDSQRPLAELGGLTPQEAYILALSMLVENGASRSSKAVFNRAPAAIRGNSVDKRGQKRFDFGFSGLDNVDHIISTLNGKSRAADDLYLERIREIMRKSG